MAVVFTNGVFDIMHPGHYQLLLYCRYLSGTDPVYVAIDSDAKVQADKGQHRPYYNQDERIELLLSLTIDGKLDSSGFGKYLVDWVEIFDSNEGLYQLIKKYKPDYIIKGDDWRDKKVVGSDLARVHYAPTYYKDFFSTTKIEERVLNKWKKPPLKF